MAEPRELVTYELDGLQAGHLPRLPEPPPGIVLRLAKSAADLAAALPAMVELCKVSFPPAITEEAVACAEVADVVRHPGLAPPGALLAFDGDLVVGLALGRVEVPAAGEGSRQAAIELLAVRPGYRRRGIGRVLLGRLLAWLAARGVDTVVASTEDRVVAAMLEGHGFRAKDDSA